MLLCLWTPLLVAQEGVPEWRIEPAMRVGSIEGAEALGPIGSVNVDPQTGRVFANEYNERILVLDSLGRRENFIGRQGQGPGEFQHLVGIFVVGDTIFTTDWRNLRISSFNQAGELIRTRTVGSNGGRGRMVRPAAPLLNGALLTESTGEVQEGEAILYATSLIRTGEAGQDSVLDEFAGESSYYPVGGGLFGVPSGDGSRYAVHPRAREIVVVHAGAIEHPDSAYFRVRKISADGSLMFSRRYRYSPVPVSDQYIRQFIEDRSTGLQAIGLTPRQGEALLRRHIPTFHMPVDELIVGQMERSGCGFSPTRLPRIGGGF